MFLQMPRPDLFTAGDDDSTNCAVLDLYDLALLLTYERYTVEPRFRHAKLVDIAAGHNSFDSISVPLEAAEWHNLEKLDSRAGLVFESTDVLEPSERDLPANMVVPSMVHNARIGNLSPTELETIFFQARTHDSCFASLSLLQYLFGLYPDSQPLRVRTDTGMQFTTVAESRHTAKFRLHAPKRMFMCFVASTTGGTSGYFTGEMATMPHISMVFAPREPADARDSVLDLSSLQFGDVGRGLGGSSLFVLEALDDYVARMRLLAERVEEPVFGGAIAFQPQHAWLEAVARRVKARYDRRDAERWCGHCGAPGELMACATCKEARYCGTAHQLAAWPFHKHYCVAPSP